MTSREIVRRAVLFQGPPRIPHALPKPWQDDFLGVGPGGHPDFKPSQPGQDEWGCVWEKVGANDATMAEAFTAAESIHAR